MRHAEKVGWTTRNAEQIFQELMNTIGESLSYLARSNEEEDWDNEDDDEDADLGKLSDDDQPGWVMDTMFKIVLHRIDRFRQKQLRHEKLTQQGWGDAAD